MSKSHAILKWALANLAARYGYGEQLQPVPSNLENLLKHLTGFTLSQVQQKSESGFCLKSIFTTIRFADTVVHGNACYIKPGNDFSLPDTIEPQEHSMFNAADLDWSAMPDLNDEQLSPDDLLRLLQKYGAWLPLVNEKDCTLSYYDSFKLLAAFAGLESDKIKLVVGDLSGIQNFIYTINPRGSLRVLRARSFYLELLMNNIPREICSKLGQSTANILYAGGGNFMLLLEDNDAVDNILKECYAAINDFFITHYDADLHLALACHAFKFDTLQDIQSHWRLLYQELEVQKRQKFRGRLDALAEPKTVNDGECNTCSIDVPEGQLIQQRCPACNSFYKTGSLLHDLEIVSGNLASSIHPEKLNCPSIETGKIWQFGFQAGGEWEYSINRLDKQGAVPIFYADYIRLKEGENSARDLPTMAQESIGAARIGVLAMDVDNMGLVFSHGIQVEYNPAFLVQIQSLSRNLDYFFKYSLRTILKKPEFHACHKIEDLIPSDERNVAVIYSGGDDLLLTGAWHDVIESAIDIRQQFGKFCCENDDLGLSAGTFVCNDGFPFYIAAKKAQQAEQLAKSEIKQTQNGLYQNEFDAASKRSFMGSVLYQTQDDTVRLKDNLVLFYDANQAFSIKTMDQEFHDRYALSIGWRHVYLKSPVLYNESLLEQLTAFLQPGIATWVKNDKENRIQFEFPKSYINKLYQLVNRFQTEHAAVYFISDLVYHHGRMNADMRNKLKFIYERYNRPDIKTANPIKYLPVLLTWIELLQRRKGDADANL